MRLTLRTLLSYLDDTLEPNQAKLIGEKVAESDVAPELIDRIKKVTRRRGLAAPPVTGDGEDTASDPNTVAEYLDNVLPADQIDAVEEAALASDTHLAEIAACHQILTLVLGEPAKVPPTARQRMYRIVKGRESIPYRKSAPAGIVAGVADPEQAEENSEADEALLLGMTGKKLLVPAAAAAILLILLVIVIWQAIPSPTATGSSGYVFLAAAPLPESEFKNEAARKQAIDKTRAALKVNKLAEAETALAEAAKISPNHPEVAKARQELNLAKNAAATQEKTRLDELLKKTIENVRTALKANKIAEAETACAEAVKLAPNHAEVVKVRNELVVAKKNFEAADTIRKAEVFRQALLRAREAIKTNKFAEADAALAEAAEIAPDSPDFKIAREEVASAKKIAAPGKADPGVGKTPLVEAKNQPDNERRAIGRLVTRDALLLSRPRAGLNWERAADTEEIQTSDTLMSLPGNRADVRLSTGVHIKLWGSLPQFQSIPLLDLQESRLVLHVPPRGFDADLTLESGRIFLTRPVAKEKQADPAKVRVRFKDEIWDITLLDGDTEICLDMLGFYPDGVAFSKEKGGLEPKAEFYFGLLQGKAGLKVKFKEYSMLQAPMRADWDSIGGEFGAPEKIKPADMEWWNKAMPEHEGAKQMLAAVNWFKEYVKKSEAALDTIFNSAMKDEKEQPNRRAYAVHCLQALEAITFLADAIDTADPPELAERSGFIVRGVGIRCIQHWCGLAPDHDLKFYKLLMEKRSYTEPEASAVMQLLHHFREDDLRRPEVAATLFDFLRHDRVAVRELAYMHLSTIDPTGAKEIGFFDVSGPEQYRKDMLLKWRSSYKKRVIDKKK